MALPLVHTDERLFFFLHFFLHSLCHPQKPQVVSRYVEFRVKRAAEKFLGRG